MHVAWGLQGSQHVGSSGELPFGWGSCAMGSMELLWMDEILHHFEIMGNHCLLVFTGQSSFQGFLGGAKWISSIHSMFLLVPEKGTRTDFPLSCKAVTLSGGFARGSSWTPTFLGLNHCSGKPKVRTWLGQSTRSEVRQKRTHTAA